MTSPAVTCPLCGQSDVDPCEIRVCRACHRTLQQSGATGLRSTGEFSVEQLMEAAPHQAAPPVQQDGNASLLSCTWCGKSSSQVKKLLSHGNAHLCNGCVALCAEILRAELGEDWDS